MLVTVHQSRECTSCTNDLVNGPFHQPFNELNKQREDMYWNLCCCNVFAYLHICMFPFTPCSSQNEMMDHLYHRSSRIRPKHTQQHGGCTQCHGETTPLGPPQLDSSPQEKAITNSRACPFLPHPIYHAFMKGLHSDFRTKPDHEANSK